MSAGESIQLDDSCDWFVFVNVGATKLVAYASVAREQIVAFHFSGELAWIPARAAHQYSLLALSEATIVVLPAAEFLAMAHECAELSAALLDRTMSALHRCREKSISLGRKQAQERIAAFLATMAARIGVAEGRGRRIDLPMSRRDIADSLGLTIETVSRQFTELRRIGLIETCGHSLVHVRDPGGLFARAGNLPPAPF